MKQTLNVIVPDLDLGSRPLRVSVWHASTGQRLGAGERLLEISAGEVIVDIPAPASGILRRRWVLEEDLVAAGQTVATLEVFD